MLGMQPQNKSMISDELFTPFLQPQEENFKLCFEFAKMNFKFHRFLDVNDLSVNRAITG